MVHPKRGNDPLAKSTPNRSKQTADGIYGEVAHTNSCLACDARIAGIVPGSVVGRSDEFLRLVHDQQCRSVLHREHLSSPLARLKCSEKHYVWDRTSHFRCWLSSGGVAVRFLGAKRRQSTWSIWFMIAPMMGLVFWIGLFWRRMSVAGAWATTLTGFAAWWLTTQASFLTWIDQLPIAASAGWVDTRGNAFEMVESWQILFYLFCAVSAGVIVSLLTPAVADQKLKRFYELTRTPVAVDEIVERPCTLPTSTRPARRRCIANPFKLEIPVPSQTSVLGFAVVWALVVALIGGFAWLVS